MPSVSPSYIYTFIALLAVSSLLILSFMAYTNAVDYSAETTQLKNLIDQVATKGIHLIMLTMTTNSTSQGFVQMPTTIGNKQYWLQLQNDFANAWLEGGFGERIASGANLLVYLPKETIAEGYYISGHGTAVLTCNFVDGTINLKLESTSGEN